MDTQIKIYQEMINAMINLGARSDLLSIVCSKGDTLSDEEILENLKDWNSTKDGNFGNAQP